MQMAALRTNHLIGHAQMREAQIIRLLCELADRAEIVAKLPNGKRDTNSHGGHSFASRFPRIPTLHRLPRADAKRRSIR